MASTELLASKVVILEEEPTIPAITALPSAVALGLGITERGPIADPTLVTSFSEYTKYFGGFTSESELAVAVHGFFTNEGSFMWVCRTCHFTDLTDPTSYTATAGAVTLQTAGTADTVGAETSGNVGPFALVDGDTLVVSTDAGGPDTATFNGAAPEVTDTTVYPVVAGVGTLSVRIDQGAVQVITFLGTETTVEQIAATINAQLTGGRAYVSAGHAVIASDTLGLDGYAQVTVNPVANPLLTFPTAEVHGTGNVGTLAAVTGLEIEAIVEAAVGNLDVVINGTGTLTFQTVTVGSTAWVRIEAASTMDAATKLDLDNVQHFGADATPENTLTVTGKTPYDNSDVQVVVAASTSGTAAEFNLQVLDDGVVKEVFPNLTMDTTASNYVETVVNDVNSGSNLVEVNDLLLPYVALLKRPANVTSGAMVGGGNGLIGLADSDYIGNEAGPTGLYCFDRVDTGRILIVPGVYSSNVHKGMMDYAETHRNGTMFCIIDCPPQKTAAQMVAWVDSESIFEYSEFGAIYWPWIKVTNPAPDLFTSDSKGNITVPYSGWIAGLYARNDKKLGGVYESPAGVGGSFGVIRGMNGVEDDPGGASQHEVLDGKQRDLVYPRRINPITKLPSTVWHIDGGRTLKSTGNFPNIGERRGVIFIETSIAQGLVILKHRFNNRENRMLAKRILTAFLIREMNKGAFRSTDPATAFFVDASDQLNPLVNVYAGIMTIRVGLATNKPAEFIVVLVTQDTRALAAELNAA